MTKSEILVSTRATDTFRNTLLGSGRPIKELGPQIKEMGGLGIHIHATRYRLTDKFLEYVYSVQQSFRSEENIFAILRHHSPALAAASYAIYPERIQSLNTIAAIQRENPNTYAIIYPLHEQSKRNGDIWNRDWAEHYPHSALNSIQNQLLEPFPELLDRWGIESAEDLIRASKDRNYDGFALSMKHILRAPESGFQSRFKDPDRVLQVLYPHTNIFFITQLEKPTSKEALSIYDYEQRILKSLKSLGWTGLLILEPDGFGSLNDLNKLSDSIKSIQAIVD